MYSRHRSWDWDDSEGERYIPRVTRTRNSESGLHPRPPAGWLKVFRYSSVPPVDSRDAAAWMYCLATVHNWERDNQVRRRSMHMISRDAEGYRVLIVKPHLADAVDEAVETINMIFSDYPCAGYEGLEYVLQLRAAKVFLRRAVKIVDPKHLPEILNAEELPPDILEWPNLSIPRRMQLVQHHRLDPVRVLDAECWTDAVDGGSGLFESMARSMHEAGQRSINWWDRDAEASLDEP